MTGSTYEWGRRPDLFARVPAWVIYHPDIAGKQQALRLYAHLALEADWTTGVYENAQKAIAEALGVDATTIYRHQKVLEAIGAIDVEATITPQGDRGHNRYLVHWTAPDDQEPAAALQEGPRVAAGTLPAAVQGGPRADAGASSLSESSPIPSTTTAEAERLAELWANLRRIPPTRGVIARWIPTIKEHLQHHQPDERFLEAAAAAGIREPGGWAHYAAEHDETDALAAWVSATEQGDAP